MYRRVLHVRDNSSYTKYEAEDVRSASTSSSSSLNSVLCSVQVSACVRLKSPNVFVTVVLMGDGSCTDSARVMSTFGSHFGTSYGLESTHAESPRTGPCRAGTDSKRDGAPDADAFFFLEPLANACASFAAAVHCSRTRVEKDPSSPLSRPVRVAAASSRTWKVNPQDASNSVISSAFGILGVSI
jgi:hypothetical protein